jgi:hypothetical protein
MNSPTVITGYAETPTSAAFAPVWVENTRRHFPNSKVITLAVGGVMPQSVLGSALGLAGNLGHIGDLLHGRKSHLFCGWSAAVLAGALLCYMNETDMIWKEQDVLCFGAPLFQMDRQLGTKGIIFGKCPSGAHACAQSLFMVRHDYIPEFVRLYIGEGGDAHNTNLPEVKFRRLLERHPDKWCQFDFGFDRERPLDFNASTWYAQRFTKDEMAELYRSRMI